MAITKYTLVLLAIFSSYVGNASKNTLKLPITINHLSQDAIQLGNLSDSIIKLNERFFKNITFSDIVKELQYKHLPQLRKNLEGLLILGLAAQNNGLTVDKFEYPETSKWTIIMAVEKLVNVSDNITLPLNDKVPFIMIQDAMFKILEGKFNFKTVEIAKYLNTTKEEVYAFLEPGWIKVVNFITKKTLLALSRNDTIPPLYIAESLNMTLIELYNLTLPQLENNITKNKTEIQDNMFMILEKRFNFKIQEVQNLLNATKEEIYAFNEPEWIKIVHFITDKNIFALSRNYTIPPFYIAEALNMSLSTLYDSTLLQLEDILVNKIDTIKEAAENWKRNLSSSVAESISVTHLKTSAQTRTESLHMTSMKATTVFMTTTHELQSDILHTRRTEMTSSFLDVTTTHMSMLQTFVMPNGTTTVYTSQASTVLSSNIVDILSTPSASFQEASKTTHITSYPIKISKTPHLETTKILSELSTVMLSSQLTTTSTRPKSSSEILTSSDSQIQLTTQDFSNGRSAPPTRSLENTISFSEQSKMTRTEAMKSSSTNKSRSIVTTSFSIIIPSKSKTSPTFSPKRRRSSTQNLLASSQFRLTTQPLSTITLASSYMRTRLQRSSSRADSSHSFLTTSFETIEGSTRKIESSLGPVTSTANDLPASTGTTGRSSLYHVTPSPTDQATAKLTTPIVENTSSSKSKDGIDTVVLAVLPVMCVLLLVAIALAFVMWFMHRRRRMSMEQKNAENGSELSSRGLVESLENVNNNRTPGIINRGADERSSRSMSRTSSMSNLETIHEGNEPEEPEIYDL